MGSINIVEKEYQKKFCDFLEITYGDGFLSEGGTKAVDSLLRGFDLRDLTILEIGSGVGGAAFYIAEQYHASVTGIEITYELVEEATRRIPESLKERVRFVYYHDIHHLPFDDASFDLAYSKGVFLHVDHEEKVPLFREIYRILKPGSHLVINDWLSPHHGIWGEKMQEMCRLDKLTICATTEEDYRTYLTSAGFSVISIESENDISAQYYYELDQHLKNPKTLSLLNEMLTGEEIETEIRSNWLVYESLIDDELLIRRIVCRKG